MRCISSLKKHNNDKVKIQCATINKFSMTKPSKTYDGRKPFYPSMLLNNIIITNYQTHIDHMWITFDEKLLEYNLAINDKISFITTYQKFNKSCNKQVDDIYNIKVLYKANDNINTFNNYIKRIIWNKEIIVPDYIIEHYYKQRTNKNISNMIEDISVKMRGGEEDVRHNNNA